MAYWWCEKISIGTLVIAQRFVFHFPGKRAMRLFSKSVEFCFEYIKKFAKNYNQLWEDFRTRSFKSFQSNLNSSWVPQLINKLKLPLRALSNGPADKIRLRNYTSFRGNLKAIFSDTYDMCVGNRSTAIFTRKKNDGFWTERLHLYRTVSGSSSGNRRLVYCLRLCPSRIWRDIWWYDIPLFDDMNNLYSLLRVKLSRADPHYLIKEGFFVYSKATTIWMNIII
jgi:hypothetical protein